MAGGCASASSSARPTPWYAKALAACVVAYALSPIDLIPDFIPVLGYLDDLLLVPLGLALAIKMIPPEVLATCREQAMVSESATGPGRWIAAGLVALLWCAVLAVVAMWVARAWRGL